MVVDVEGHGCAVNSQAWQMLDLPLDTPDVGFPLNGKRGGRLVGEANTRARYQYYKTNDDALRRMVLHRATEMALRVGITTVQALDGGSQDGHSWFPENDVDVLLRAQDRLPVRAVIFFQSTGVQKALEWSLSRLRGLDLCLCTSHRANAFIF